MPTAAARPGERLLGLGIAAASLGGLAAAYWAEPSSEGHGTHTQFGMPPCHWAVALDWPCATCGMTTAVSLATHGRLIEAVVTQPAGAVAAVAASVAFWSGLHVAATGSRLGQVYGRILTPRVLGWALALLLASWAYKAAVWRAG